MKRILSLILALAMILSLAAVASADVTYPVEGNPTVTWWHPLRAPSYQSTHDDNIVWKQIEENTGIDIQWIHPASGTESEQLNLMIVSGDLPDIIQIDGYLETAGGSVAYVDDGVFLDLTDYLQEYAPDYVAAMTASDLAYAMATTPDGRVTHFSQMKQTAPQYSRETLRVDIQEEIGWGDKLPVTIDDYTKLFADLKEHGYWGWAPTSTGLQTHFMYAYNISNSFFLREDGSVAFGPYTEEYKDYITQMHKWYEAGYLYPDFTGSITRSALFDSKEVGLLITPSDIAYGAAKLAGYEIYIVNYPRLYEGQQYRFETTTWDAVPADGIRTVVTASCKDIPNAIKLLNFGYTEEGALLYNWGIEGVTYTVDADGKKTYTDLILNNDTIPASDGQYIFKLHFGPKLAEPDVSCNPGTIGDPKALYFRELYSDDETVDSTGIIFATLTAEQSTARAEYMVDIDTYYKQMVLQFILGQTDIESNWDNYMATMKSMGIEEAIAITQEAVDVFNAKEIPTDWVSASK